MLFLARQMAQQIPAKPTIWNLTTRGINISTQIQKDSQETAPQSTPTTTATRLQMCLAIVHSKNICCTVLFCAQKQHFPSPFQFLLSKLFFIKIAFCSTNHIKIHKKFDCGIFAPDFSCFSFQFRCQTCESTLISPRNDQISPKPT